MVTETFTIKTLCYLIRCRFTPEAVRTAVYPYSTTIVRYDLVGMEATIVSAPQSVKLRSDADWLRWIRYIQEQAETDGIWDLLDPEADDEERPEPIVRPERPDWGNLTKAERTEAIEIYKMEFPEWERQSKALAAIRRMIMQSVDATVAERLYSVSTLYERLRFLRDRFSNANTTNETYRERWSRYSQVPPAKGEDIRAWARRWEQMRDRMLAAGRSPEANEDFLVAVRHLVPNWHTGQYQLVVHEKKKLDNGQLVSQFLDHYRMHYGNALAPSPPIVPATLSAALSIQVSQSRPNNAFSTLHDHEEATPSAAASAPNRKKRTLKDIPLAERYCMCMDRSHKPWECAYVNPKLRTAGWQPPDQDKMARPKRLEMAMD
ncbi:hypothetical protein N7533_011566 [Penicillium manginii]|uniref:uncharacterized protein n=1 Tax=Penicillium manginii TaxID=203109 RepID=UPI002547EDB3|nr:uncharacterized protein N7533_011566 [Penicillium manginii]KAJ5742157.1 hypothetical protein N7533_011566 [Penicillium manginii]